MQNVGLYVRFVLGQAIENIDRLPSSTRDEMREQRDVVIADVIVGDTALTSVADVALRQQIVFVQVPLGAVGGGPFGIAPIAR